MKNTIQQYGWIVITVIIIAILIGISAPAAMYLRDNVVGVVGGFGDLMSGDNSSGGDEDGSGDEDEVVPGLYQTGSNYTVLITPWEELVSSGAIVVENGAVSRGYEAQKNEFGFYYDMLYLVDGESGFVFHEDTSFDLYDYGELIESVPAGNITYSVNSIDMSAFNMGIGTVSPDGLMISFGAPEVTFYGASYMVFVAASPTSLFQTSGDLMLPTDKSITNIAMYAFSDCTNLTGIKIANNITGIGDYAFSNCVNLTNIEIPDTVTLYEFNVFESCENIATVIYKGTLEQWCQINFSSSPCRYGADLYIGDKMATEIVIPSTITEIKENSFFGCTSLTNVTIPKTVTTIGRFAFADCVNLSDVMFDENSNLTNIDGYSFRGCTSLQNIIIPNRVTVIGSAAFNNCTSLTSINIPSSVTEIGYQAFRNCSNLVSIDILNGVSIIDRQAFYNCKNLANISLPSSVTSIGKEAFYNCSNLTKVTFGESSSLTSLGENAFSLCKNLESIQIPNGTTIINKGTFDGCTNLASIKIPVSVKTIDGWSFRCENLETIVFSGTVAQWKAISKGTNWNQLTPDYIVICTNGTVAKNGTVTMNPQ